MVSGGMSCLCASNWAGGGTCSGKLGCLFARALAKIVTCWVVKCKDTASRDYKSYDNNNNG